MPLGFPSRSVRSMLGALIAFVAAFSVLTVAAPAPARAASGSMQAVLLTSSVTNDPAQTVADAQSSLEYKQAVAAGYTVTPKTDAEWKAMTTSDFAGYQLIIIGDPSSGCAYAASTGSVAQTTASQWEPAVMGTGVNNGSSGNKVLIGTDPSHHYELGATAAPQLEENSLTYAGAVSGATGLYLALGCSFDSDTYGTSEPILNGLTSGTGQFAVEGYNSFPSKAACDTTVNIVAATGPTSGLTDPELGQWDCSVHNVFTSVPSDYTPLVLAPTSSGFPSVYCANDVQSMTQACGAPYILVSGGGVSVSSDISLSPASQNQATSPSTPGSATVQATVTSGGSPDSGQTVTFTVNGGPDVGQTYTGTTDSNGQTTFTLKNKGVSGSDSVSASFTNGSGYVEKALATVNFQGPGQVTGAAQNISGVEKTPLGNPALATFTDPTGSIGAGGWTAQINWGDNTSDSTCTGSTGSCTVAGTGQANQYSVKADHTYAAPGFYTVTITITDAGNSSYTTTVTSTATISQGQIAVTAQAPSSPVEGTSISDAQVATFTSTDTAPGASSYTAKIDWGDGTPSTTGTITAVSGTPGSFTVSGSHTYSEAGSDPVKVTVTGGDNSSTSASDQATATVAEAPITVSAGTLTPNASQAFSGQVATFTDGNPLTGLSDYTATINWGDGTPTTTGTITGSNGSFTVTGGHTYATAGTYPLSVTVSENDGGPSATDTGTGSSTAADITLTVAGRGTLELPSETLSGTLATIHYGTASAPAGGFTAAVKWGDGSTGTGTVTGSGGNYTVTGSHTYSGAGPYPMTVTVTDPANGTAVAATTVMVPSTLAALSLPASLSAKKLLCGIKRHAKCAGVTILGTFRSAGSAVWDVSISRSGKHSVSLGVITRTVTAGSTNLVFKVTNRSQSKRLYKLIRKHRLNQLSVHQVFTNVAGASSQMSLFTRVTR